MSTSRRTARHSALTDPMVTNSYLIRARTIRDSALTDADRRERLAQVGAQPIWTRMRVWVATGIRTLRDRRSADRHDLRIQTVPVGLGR
ncbi:MAG TPA: hypothetical protein VEQ36_10445 [Thermomicrobiales bacterium]|nr:hypothetical protein [Thermomicrobiales bacterium]